MQLSRLTHYASIKEKWKDEEAFSEWLAKEENLTLLANEIQVPLINPEREKQLGRLRADIVAEDGNTGHPVVIENQFGATNYKHLGQLLTYAGGLQAGICIWIADRAQEPHQQAINYLNEKYRSKDTILLSRSSTLPNRRLKACPKI